MMNKEIVSLVNETCRKLQKQFEADGYLTTNDLINKINEDLLNHGCDPLFNLAPDGDFTGFTLDAAVYESDEGKPYIDLKFDMPD